MDGDATGSEHSSGSAVAYEGADAPTTRPGGADLADNAIDNGRLWIDDTASPGTLKRWKTDGFEGFGSFLDVDGTLTPVYTKYLTGTTDADGSTSVAHGITGIDKIISVNVIVYDGAKYIVSDVYDADDADQIRVRFDGTNVILTLGTTYQSKKYRIKIEYIL